jgi:hypothetical protein
LRRLALAVAVPLLMVLAIPAVAAAAKPYYLNVYDKGKDPYAGPLATKKLEKGVPYVAKVSGTFSFFDKQTWTGGTKYCGKTERKPVYKSKGRPNGQVDGDALFLFANIGLKCTTAPLVTATTFQVKTRNKYYKAIPIGGFPSAPTADHTYRLPLLGYGKKAKFRLFDDFTRDNYGMLRITIFKATGTQCAAGFAGWGFADAASCQAAIAR